MKSIQSHSSVTNPTIGTCCILLPFYVAVAYNVCFSIGNFGDKNVESERCTYDVNLKSPTGACPIVALEPRQIDIICTAFMFYLFATKGHYSLCVD